MTLDELSRYTKLLYQLETSEELLESMKEASRPGSAIMGGMPHSKEVKDKIGNLVVEIADLTERVKYLNDQVPREKKKLEKFISDIDDNRVRIAFRLRFVRALTWVQTAEILGEKYTAENVKKLCYQYIDDME